MGCIGRLVEQSQREWCVYLSLPTPRKRTIPHSEEDMIVEDMLRMREDVILHIRHAHEDRVSGPVKEPSIVHESNAS